MQSATKRLMRKWTVPSCSSEDSEVCNAGRLVKRLCLSYYFVSKVVQSLCFLAAKGCDTVIPCAGLCEQFSPHLGIDGHCHRDIELRCYSICLRYHLSSTKWCLQHEACRRSISRGMTWIRRRLATNQILSGMGPWIENDFPEETKWNAWKEIVVASCDVLHKRWHSWFNPSSQNSDVLCLFGCGMMWQ